MIRWTKPERFVFHTAAFSPNARWLAIQLNCPRPNADGRGVPLLVNTRTGFGYLVPGSASDDFGTPVWSADGRWLIWESGAGDGTWLRFYKR